MFGQVIVGPPGSGKSTYCHGMFQLLSAIGRKCAIINLDPANPTLQYPSCSFDIRDYITLDEVMNKENLGPNGGLMYALESLSENSIELLTNSWMMLGKENYLLFDCPGQVELFTSHNSFFKIFERLAKVADARLCVVSLVDSVNLTSPSSYISSLLLCLRSMFQLGLSQVNVLSKIDKLSGYGKLPMRLDFYTGVQDLKLLKEPLTQESPTFLGKNFVRLSEMISEIIEDYDLVNFEVLAVENKRSMIHLLSVIDKANGYILGSNEIGGDDIWAQAVRNTQSSSFEEVDVHERWIEHKEAYDKAETSNDSETQVQHI